MPCSSRRIKPGYVACVVVVVALALQPQCVAPSQRVAPLLCLCGRQSSVAHIQHLVGELEEQLLDSFVRLGRCLVVARPYRLGIPEIGNNEKMQTPESKVGGQTKDKQNSK